MAVEIERKFLVVGDAWRSAATSATPIAQGYLATSEATTVRARLKGDRGYLTIKGRTTGISRSEFEYEIPVEDVRAMLAEMAVGGVVEKVRHLVDVGPHTWEVDVFEGANAGLIMAEVELPDEDALDAVPEWAGREVTSDPRYYNVYLAENPYPTWAGDAP